VTTDGELYERDPEAWNAYLAEGNAKQARKRVSARRTRTGIQVGDLLCADWVSPHGPWDDLLNFIFDGGALSNSDIKGLRLVDSELRAFEFCDEGQAKQSGPAGNGG
jgi:8-oxo-dGTP diphosphatase